MILGSGNLHTIRCTTGPYVLSACDPAGTRTQDPLIKSQVLYRLSYEIIGGVSPFFKKRCKYTGFFQSRKGEALKVIG
jgi:hypothetical protein